MEEGHERKVSWWADMFEILSSLSSPERNVCGEV
jgi:hypothetical protein